MKIYDIFLGRLDGWHTRRVAQGVTDATLKEWIAKGFTVQTEIQIGTRLHEVYLVT